VGLLLAEAAVLGGAAIARRPDLTANESFLFGDQSLNILIADHILRGDRLYADIFSPYGPVAPYLHAAFAAVAGNSIAAYNLLLLILTLVNVVLAYVLIRSRAPVGVALLVVGVKGRASAAPVGPPRGTLLSLELNYFDECMLAAAAGPPVDNEIAIRLHCSVRTAFV
jgi:hypothetical protein